jgi:PAS domain S-box-containing protein
VSVLDLLVGSVVDYAIFVLDVDGTVLTWNPGAERMKGYAAEEIIGRNFSTFYTKSDLDDGFPERELAIAAADGRFEDEGWRVRKDGSTFWANVVITALRGDDGRLVGFGKVTRDLTERKRGEDALRESEERFRLLVSDVIDYAIFLLDPEGRVVTWNLGAERLKGYRADEIIGQHFSRFYTADDLRSGVPQSGLRTAVEEGRWRSEGWRVRKDGTRFWADVVITALRGHDGALRGFAKVTRDLTERKRSDDALRGVLERERDAAEQLRGVDRMRRELVTLVAHDLRGPVSVVLNLLDLVLDGWEELDDDVRRERVERARRRAGTLAELTDDVFDISLIDSGTLELSEGAIDVRAIAVEVVDDVNAGHPDQPTAFVKDGPAVLAWGDHRRTWQVLTNVVSNAVKFSTGEAPVTIAVSDGGPEVCVSVHNAGAGIPIEDQDRIFDRFVRLPGAQRVPGSGLGLFIARSLVEAQGGHISVTSSDAEGTTFMISLPAAGVRDP